MTLTDWIKNDDKLPTEITKVIEEQVKIYDSIMIAADLANRSKHYLLTKNIRKDAKPVKGVTIYPLPAGSGETGHASYEFRITCRDRYDRTLAIDIAKQAVKDWNEILKDLKLL